MKFDDLSLEKLRDLARSKKGHPGLKGFTTMKKDDLKKAIKKHFKIGGGSLEERANPLIKGDQYRMRKDIVGTGKDPVKEALERKKKAAQKAYKAKQAAAKKEEAAAKKKASPSPNPAPEGDIRDDLQDFDNPVQKPTLKFYPELAKKKLTEGQANAIRAYMKEKMKGGTLPDLPDEVIRKIEGYLPFEGSVSSNLRRAQFGDPAAPTEQLYAQSSGHPRLSEILNHPGARTSDRMDVGSRFFDDAQRSMGNRVVSQAELQIDNIFGDRDNQYEGAPDYTSIKKPRKHKRIGENPLGSPPDRNQFDLDLPMRKRAKGGKLVQVLRKFVDRIKARRDDRVKGGQVSESVKNKARDIVVGGANMTKTNYLTPCWKGYESVPGKEVYTKGSCRKIGGKGADEDDIDFDDIKWGKFSDQLNRYNTQNKKNLDLCAFADLILSNPKKYTMTTQRRARFYKNVLAKKKC